MTLLTSIDLIMAELSSLIGFWVTGIGGGGGCYNHRSNGRACSRSTFGRDLHQGETNRWKRLAVGHVTCGRDLQ